MTLEYPMFSTRDLIIPGAVSDIDVVIEMGGTCILPGDRFW